MATSQEADVSAACPSAAEVSTLAPLTMPVEAIEAADTVEAAMTRNSRGRNRSQHRRRLGTWRDIRVYGGYGPGYYDNSYAYDNGYGGYDNGYAIRNGFVCQAGTVFRGEVGRPHLCQ